MPVGEESNPGPAKPELRFDGGSTKASGTNSKASLSAGGRKDRTAITRRSSLSIPPGLPLPEWRHLGRQIFIISDSSAWWLGDWLLYGQNHYPDRYRRALSETSLEYQTLRNYAWVARKFSTSRRRDRLSFQHHAEVAGLPEGEQDEWLTRAEKSGWTRNELRKRIRADRQTGPGTSEGALVQMNIVPERREQWRRAAESEGLELLEWIIATLDRAIGGEIIESGRT